MLCVFVAYGYLPVTNGEKVFFIKGNSISDSIASPVFEQDLSFGDVLKLPLEKGLTALIPTVLLGDTNQTYPISEQVRLKALNDSLNDIAHALNQQGVFLKTGNVINSWNVFQHFYPYFDEVNVDWDKVLRNTISHCQKPESSLLEILGEMVASLKDGHGSVINLHSQENLGYTLPLKLKILDDRIVVTYSLVDEAQPGGIIKKINGVNAMDYFNQRLKFAQGATDKKRKDYLCQNIFKGPKDTQLEISVEDENGVSRLIKMHRELKSSKLSDFHYIVNENKKIEELEKGIYYVNLTTTNPTEFRNSVNTLKEAGSIIFDLRGYPKRGLKFLIGHFIDQRDTSKLFYIPKVTHPDLENTIYQSSGWGLLNLSPKINTSVFLLIDETAISYSESLASFFEHYKLATIIGEPTAGTNGNTNPFILPGGYHINWTGMKVKKQDGSQLHGVGITPDVYVTPTIQGIREDRDEILEKALELARKEVKKE